MTDSMNRREVIAALASSAAVPLVAACSREPSNSSSSSSPSSSASSEADALKLLDEVGNNLLRLYPEGATSLGIDTGARSAYRSQLTDRSAAGQEQIANQLRADLQRVNAFNTAGLSYATRTSFEVIRSAYAK